MKDAGYKASEREDQISKMDAWQRQPEIKSCFQVIHAQDNLLSRNMHVRGWRFAAQRCARLTQATAGAEPFDHAEAVR